MLLFIGAAASFLLYFIGGIERYRNFNVTTNLDYRSEDTMEFPSVTICNFNYARKSYFTEKNDPMYTAVGDLLDRYTPSDVDITDPEIKQALESIYTMEVGFDASHHTDMFLNCDFHSQDSSDLPCQFPEELFVERITQMGNCFTFQPSDYVEKNGQLNSTRAGSQGGLFLRVDVQQYDYKIGLLAAGIKVGLHHFNFD